MAGFRHALGCGARCGAESSADIPLDMARKSPGSISARIDRGLPAHSSHFVPCLSQRDGSGELNLKELHTALKTWVGPKAIAKGRVELTLPVLLDRDFAAEAHGARLLFLVENYEERSKAVWQRRRRRTKPRARRKRPTQRRKRSRSLRRPTPQRRPIDWQAIKTKLEESRAEVKSQLKQEMDGWICRS